jgi:ubiquinone/menaquinone biosynthesis C-methylase UbiE
MIYSNTDAQALKKLFREIGLNNPKGDLYKARTRKHQQVMAYIQQIEAAANKLSHKRPITILDCACGKSYVAFVLYHYFSVVLKRRVKIIGIDNNPDLIAKCQKTAENLKLSGLRFVCSDVEHFTVDEPIDIVYSLHACDKATDQTIAKGLSVGARVIFSVSCCQHSARKALSNHPLKPASRFQVYKERIVDIVGDSMRALLLEERGYGVKIYEFVASSQTPKNVMMRATKNAVRLPDRLAAEKRYQDMASSFGLEPYLKTLVDQETAA